MSAQWYERAGASLAPLSIEGYDLKNMLKEWYYNGNTFDLGVPIENCSLCGHQNIRYQFEISNLHTNHTLLIGSECITKFNIPAMSSSGEQLDFVATKKKVDKDKRKLIVDAQHNRVITALIQLAREDNDFDDLERSITYYQDRKAFTPSHLSFLLWRLKKNKIDFKKSDMKMTIQRNREKEQFLELLDWKVKIIWPCLSDSQRKWYHKNKAK